MTILPPNCEPAATIISALNDLGARHLTRNAIGLKVLQPASSTSGIEYEQ